MTNKFLYPLFALALVFATACRKDSVVTDTTMEPTPPVITIETSVLGLVTNLNGTALQDALLTLGNSQTTSDENGYFKLTGLADADNAIIKVEMAGYFDAWHAFEPFKEDIAQTKIRLTPRANPLNINAINGGDIQFENTKISFQAGSFVDASGNAYTGNVSIYTAYLDPTDPGLHTFMPGNLTAFNAENRLKLLETFGMINVELEGNAGQKLQINQPATIEMAVPASIMNQAPATILLWHFDTEKQRWAQEGSATLQGGKYIGTVSHFTFWNWCLEPGDYIKLYGKALVGGSGANLTVCVTDLSNNAKRCTQTSANDGYFAGSVPLGEELLLEIAADCGGVVFSEDIGPFNNNTTVGPYQINPTQTWALVHGNVHDCNAEPVLNGYVYGWWGNGQGEFFSLDGTGSFSKYVNTCNEAEITLKAIDTDALKSGDPLQFALVPVTDAGTLEACNSNVVEGVFIEYGPNMYAIPGPTISSPFTGSGNPVQVMQINIVDDQGNGDKIVYQLTLIYWGSSTYDYEIKKTVIGNPSPVFDFTGGDIILSEDGQLPGELIIFDVSGVTVTMNGTDYPDGSIKIIGIIH